MKDAEEGIKELLRQRFKVQPGADDPFSIRNLTEILQAQEASSRVMTMLLAAVAGISLVIGGIGIMNIMLVSVTERTREIGLRMAVGARGKDILTQFLIEAVTLSLIGGAIGVLIGGIATWAVGQFAGWQVSMTPASIGLAAGFSAFVGHLLRLLSGAPRFAAARRSRRCATNRPRAGRDARRRTGPAIIALFARSARGLCIAGQGRHHGGGRGPDRVPADFEHRPPDPRRRACWASTTRRPRCSTSRSRPAPSWR